MPKYRAMPEHLLNASQVAAQLGYTAKHFRDHWRELRRTLGFPAPVWGLVWTRRSIDDYVRRREEAAMTPPPAPGRPPKTTDEAARRRAIRNVERLARERAEGPGC
jgi:hypothetical protein